MYKLTFKKAFGIEHIPVDSFFWFLELAGADYNFPFNDKSIKFTIGRFGTTDQEKTVLSLFRHSDERDLNYIAEIPTLDVSFNVEVNIPPNINEKWKEISIANELIKPFIHDALSAINHFFDSCRDVKYLEKRGSKEWRSQQTTLIPQMTDAEFRTFLFYIFESNNKKFIGCFSAGQARTASPLNNKFKNKLQRNLEQDIPLERKLMVRAWEYFFQEDLKSSVIYSAMVIELVLASALRKTFTSRSIASVSRIDKFIEQTSNRLLSTVVLGFLGIGDETLREGLAQVFELRNGLVHGGRRSVSREDAQTALDHAEKFMIIIENTNIK